jgi:hypothetical protein
MLRLVATDSRSMHDSYWDWLADIEVIKILLNEKGIPWVEIDVRVHDLTRWCQDNGVPNDGPSRSKYASFRGRELEKLGL